MSRFGCKIWLQKKATNGLDFQVLMAPSKKGVYVGRQLEIHGPTEWPGQEDDPKVAGKVTEYQEESKGRIERYRVLCPDGWHEWVPVEFVEKYLVKDIEDPNSNDNITADEDTDGTGASQLKSSSDNLGDEGGREGEDGDSGQDKPPTDSEDETEGLPPRRSMRLSPQKPEKLPKPSTSKKPSRKKRVDLTDSEEDFAPGKDDAAGDKSSSGACIWHACACVTLVSLRTSLYVTYVTYKLWHGCRGF
jgi:hypothetical protein